VQNTLVGFTHENGFRRFSFDRLGDDHVRTRCTVRADLALIRGFGIQIQELPLLCRGVLDRSDEGSEIQTLTLAEGDMRKYASDRAALRKQAAKKRKPWRRPVVENVRVLPGGPGVEGSRSLPVFPPDRN
jgi:hypothetical protein